MEKRAEVCSCKEKGDKYEMVIKMEISKEEMRKMISKFNPMN